MDSLVSLSSALAFDLKGGLFLNHKRDFKGKEIQAPQIGSMIDSTIAMNLSLNSPADVVSDIGPCLSTTL